MDERLFLAIKAENYRTAQDLCLKGARADQLQGGITSLHLLAGHESQEASDILELCFTFKKGSCDPNVRSVEGLTPLHVAAIWGRLQNIQILAKNGANIKDTDEEGTSALDHAADPQCIKLLLELESIAETCPSVNINEQPVQHERLTGKPTAKSTANDTASDFTDSFYTAIDSNSILEQTVVTFPKLHPWHTDLSSTCDADDTIVDEWNNLRISSYSFPDSLMTLDESKLTETAEQPSYHEHDLSDEDCTIIYDWKDVSTVLDKSVHLNDSVIVPDGLQKLSNMELKKELVKYGEIPGPIITSTRNVYIRRLARLQSGATFSKDTQFSEYLPELRLHMEGRAATPDFFNEEESMCQEFALKKNWREGTEKSSFNYLLIDPRVTQNLPTRAKRMTEEEVFRVFIMAVFYVGKGKRSRPYAHLNEALNSTKDNPKIEQIKDIWTAGHGVVSLHIFQSVIPVEAYTREACMIDALGLPRLTNKKRGDYYGRAKTWPQKKRREMGVFLLKRALKILLSEGERELRPEDLKVKQPS